jgi:uncharacterized protein (AIM24 family)
MAYMSNGMKMDVKLAGIGKTFGRLVGGGSLFQLTFTNETNYDGYIAMSPDYPGVIVPIRMETSGKIYALRDSFLCSTVDIASQTTDVGGGFNPANSVAAKCCGGFDFIVSPCLTASAFFIHKVLSPSLHGSHYPHGRL